jgi:hypothetical protein
MGTYKIDKNLLKALLFWVFLISIFGGSYFFYNYQLEFDNFGFYYWIFSIICFIGICIDYQKNKGWGEFILSTLSFVILCFLIWLIRLIYSFFND